MSIRDQLSLYAYNLGTTSLSEYGSRVEALTFTTVASGGFGHLSCKLKVPDLRVVPPQLRLFARVALMDGPFACFQGRWDQPALKLDATDGEHYELTAQGASSFLTDDPDDYAYSAQTMQAILANQVTARSAYIAIDQDTTQIMPDAPAATYDRAFAGMDVAQILGQELPKLGSIYDWYVWDHPTRVAAHQDAAGFPTYQLSVLLRDTTTIHYTGYFEDEAEAAISPAVEWTYNAIELLYRDATTGALTKTLVKDARLNTDKSQGNAPYPFRKKRIDLSGQGTYSATQATNLANALLAAYQNGGTRDSVKLTRVYDANGVQIPLHQVRAGRNIFLPQFAPIGATLPTTATPNVNLFFIQETSWSEDATSTGGPELAIAMQTFDDSANYQLTRLQDLATRRAQDARVTAPAIQAAGAAWKMRWGFQGDVDGVRQVGPQLPFLTQQSNAPSSLTFAQVFAPINVGVGPSVNVVDQFGASVWVQAGGAGVVSFGYTVTVAGNCLVDVDEEEGTYTYHCDSCEARAKRRHGCVGMACEACHARAIQAGLSITEALRVDRSNDRGGPGQVAIAHDCPDCGVTECFLPNSFAHDADPEHPTNHADRARHVALIRRVQRHLGHRVSEHCEDPDGCASCDAYRERQDG